MGLCVKMEKYKYRLNILLPFLFLKDWLVLS